jgi:hypothetical protein
LATHARRTAYHSKKRDEHKSCYDDAHRNTFMIHHFPFPEVLRLKKKDSKEQSGGVAA